MLDELESVAIGCLLQSLLNRPDFRAQPQPHIILGTGRQKQDASPLHGWPRLGRALIDSQRAAEYLLPADIHVAALNRPSDVEGLACRLARPLRRAGRRRIWRAQEIDECQIIRPTFDQPAQFQEE